MVESKFWATLTRNQPITYLRHLTPDKESIVLFIAPSSRFPTLWNELIHHCTKSGLSVDQKIDRAPEYIVAEVEPKKLLGLVSWESLLSYLKKELEDNGVIEGAYEVWQVQGLCERLDAEAFHPLQAVDLKSNADVKIEEYRRLVNDLVGMLCQKGYANTKGYSASPGPDYYKRYITLYGNKNWSVEYNGTYWDRFERTPIWLTLDLASKVATQSIKKLSPLKEESPSKLFEDGKQALIPLELALNVEREDILKSLVQQIEEIKPFIGA
jgi:hypothetical protein